MRSSAASPVYTLFVGIDIAAKTATAVWTTDGSTASHPLTIEQTAHGYALLHAQLEAIGHAPTTTLVVMETTGTYWMTFGLDTG
jgi:transposase